MKMVGKYLLYSLWNKDKKKYLSMFSTEATIVS